MVYGRGPEQKGSGAGGTIWAWSPQVSSGIHDVSGSSALSLVNALRGCIERADPGDLEGIYVLVAGVAAAALARLVGRGVREREEASGPAGAPVLLTTAQMARVLAVSPKWLTRRARELPFAVHLGPRALRWDGAAGREWQRRHQGAGRS